MTSQPAQRAPGPDRRVFVVGTRGSALALRQTDMAIEALQAANPAASFEVREIRTLGDRRQDIPLSEAGGKGIFVKDIEDALLAGVVDIAIHSAKDMAAEAASGTAIPAALERGNAHDLLVVREGAPSLDALPAEARVGTGSLRRAAQVLRLRPDLRVESIRGNVDTRLRKLNEGQYDALVLAAAGIERLGLSGLNAAELPYDVMLPAPGQGAIALQCRTDDLEAHDLLEAAGDLRALTCLRAERALMRALEAGCRMPLGAIAEVEGDALRIRAAVWSADGGATVAGETVGPAEDPERLGEELAADLLERGAASLDASIGQMPVESHRMELQGSIWLVGAGPGDPGLITVRGRDLLRRADVVVYDRLVDPRLLDETREGCEHIYVGKDPNGRSTPQERINEILVEQARQGRLVVRLKGGDPFVFGRGGEEAEAAADAGIRCHVVPGITSAIAGLAAAGIPITHRAVSTSFAVATGSEDPTKEAPGVDWQALATAADTLVVLMGTRGLESITSALLEGGRPGTTPAALIEWATDPRQRVVAAPLERIAATAREVGIGPPAILVVGEVVGLRDWLFPPALLPLAGKRILVTRTREQASALSERLTGLGAVALELPSLRLVPAGRDDLVDEGVRRLGRGDVHWMVFTSANGVRAWFRELDLRGLDARAFAGVRICCIGPATAAALKDKGVRADLVPERYVGEEVARALTEAGVAGQAVLIPRAEGARPVLPESLAALGCEVLEVPLYTAAVPTQVEGPALELLRAGQVDIATFASSSSFRNLLEMLGDERELLRGVRIASIGPITSATIREAGFEPAVEASEHTIDGLVDAIGRSISQLEHES